MLNNILKVLAITRYGGYESFAPFYREASWQYISRSKLLEPYSIQGGPSEVIQSNISKTSRDREKCFV